VINSDFKLRLLCINNVLEAIQWGTLTIQLYLYFIAYCKFFDIYVNQTILEPVASFFGCQSYLVSIWLNFNSRLNLKKGEESSKLPPFKRFKIRRLVTFREGVSTLNVRNTLREPLDFIYFLCYNLLGHFIFGPILSNCNTHTKRI